MLFFIKKKKKKSNKRRKNAYKIKLNRTKEYMKCYEKQILYQISTVLIPIRGTKVIERISQKGIKNKNFSLSH